MDAVKAFHSKARQVNRTRVMRSIRSAVKGLVTTEGTRPRAVDRPQHHAPINVVSDTQRGNYKRPHWISHAVKPHKAQLLAAGAEADRWVAHIDGLMHKDDQEREKLKAWMKLPAAKRKAILIERWGAMSVEEQQAALRAKRKEEELVAFRKNTRVFDPTKSKYTQLHTRMKLSPFTTIQGPLPGGWHMGKKGAVTYYWNDSGAKQLHIPSTPYLAKIRHQSGFLDDVAMEQKIGKHIDRGASLMDYIKDEQPAGPNAKGSNKDLSPEAINESIGKEIASKSGFGG